MTEISERQLWPSIWKAVRGRCPNCGQGKLFAGYLKQVDACSSCGENLADIRADDGPAWATILLTGHILAPFIFPVATGDFLAPWMITGLLISATIGLVLTILPRAKGLFIAIIWARRLKTA